MKFSERWLREWVDPPVETQALADQLTMAGLEVDAIEPVAPAFSGVVVGRVLAVAPHPQADRLRVCQVDVGESEPLTIVCGAPNVAAGMMAPVARVGARLPSGEALKRARLRGVESHGMLCSSAELGLGEGSAGLMALPATAEPGADLREYLQLDDCVIELGLTPNRGDCLGLAGIAREVGVLNRIAVTPPPMPSIPAGSDFRFPLTVENPAACPRYIGRVIKGIDARAETPVWMRERLRRGGIRSISPVVDVTNYVLLELGQPMHAFDLDRLQGGIIVRDSGAGEAVTLLDGRRLELARDTLVIADRRGPVALAGIMGGLDSAVGEATSALFLECAYFAPEAISGKARAYGLHTDSSHRFERGVDPELQELALERATGLLLDIVGGTCGPLLEAASTGHLPRRPSIRLRAQRLERLLGYRLERGEAAEILSRLGMEVREDETGWDVTPPAFRFDIAIEADLIEEIARIHGYDNLPDSRPRGRLEIGGIEAGAERIRRARRLLADRGYQEAITYSFVDAERQALLDPGAPLLALANPISADTAVMRTNLWPGLVQACVHNLNRQQPGVRLFECGTRFRQESGAMREERVIAGIAAGEAYPQQWGLPARAADFYDVKGDVEALLQTLGGSPSRYDFTAATHPALHPGQTARVHDGDSTIGWLGLIHPETAAALGLECPVLVFELDLDRIPLPAVPVFTPLSRFPAVRRDLAVIVAEGVTAEALCGSVRAAAGTLLQDLQLFDVYRGKGIDSGRKSIALGLTLQDFSRTLTDQEIDALIERVLKQLYQEVGATLRE